MMRRKDREMPAEFALEVIDRADWGAIATSKNNVPYCLPVSIVRDGNYIYFHSAKKGQKNDYFAENNQVSLTCVTKAQALPQEFTVAYESAIICGAISLVADEAERYKALKLLCEKYASEYMHLFQNEMDRHSRHTAIWRIDIREITGKKYK